MDYVFLKENLTQTSVVSVDGNIHYNINTTCRGKPHVPITRIEETKVAPVKRLSRKDFLRCPNSKEIVASVEWKTIVMPLRLHSKFIPEQDGKGIIGTKFLKRPHALSVSDRYLFFKGHDGVKYRWKTTKNNGCTLTRAEDGREIAWGAEKMMYSGLFRDQIKWVLHVKTEELTLDVSMILMTFLVVDHARLERHLGRWLWFPRFEEISDSEDIDILRDC